MSTSTVSITANHHGRQRPVASGEPLTPTKAQAINGSDPVGSDKVTVSNGRDLSQSLIRREAILERTSKDSMKVKKGIANGSVPSPRKIRRVVPKPEKPLWLTIASVFTKNFLLLMLLIGLVQMVGRLVTKVGDSDSSMGFVEVEGRIAEVESLVKSTTKMIQVQVEVLDKKIEKEVGGLRKETQDVIDRIDAVYDRQMKELADKSQVLEKYVEELKAVDWLSKDEFNKFNVEIMKGKDIKGSKLGDNDLSLDDVRTYAREIVRKEIEKHAADGLGMVDYALGSAGGKVVKHSGTINWFLGGVHPDADKMLKPSFGEPGQCFPLKGSAGFVQIALRTRIVPQAFTLEHVAKSVAYDRSSAPKDCRVSGWLREGDTEKWFLLAEFTYDLEKSNAQTFDVLDSAASGVVDMIRLDFSSNHGSPHTCLYRFRVHGYEPDTASLTAM